MTNIAEHDAKWSGDNGATISSNTPVDDDCAPACTPDFHVC